MLILIKPNPRPFRWRKPTIQRNKIKLKKKKTTTTNDNLIIWIQ